MHDAAKYTQKKKQQTKKVIKFALSQLDGFVKCTGLESLFLNRLPIFARGLKLDKLCGKFYAVFKSLILFWQIRATRCYIKRIMNDFVHAMGHEIWHSARDSPLVYSTRRCAPC